VGAVKVAWDITEDFAEGLGHEHGDIIRHMEQARKQVPWHRLAHNYAISAMLAQIVAPNQQPYRMKLT
jgi:hypothetical protein